MAGAEIDNEKILTMRLGDREDINQPDEDGDTLILLAAQEDWPEDLVRLLITRGANLHQENDRGETPLFVAIQNKHPALARIFLESGADANRENFEQETPLLRAISEGNADVVHLLLQHGADCNKITIDGLTPLFLATTHSHREIITMLLDQGAEVVRGNLFDPLAETINNNQAGIRYSPMRQAWMQAVLAAIQTRPAREAARPAPSLALALLSHPVTLHLEDQKPSDGSAPG